jgi:hypothetical protein
MELLEGAEGQKYVYVPEVDEVMPIEQFQAWLATANEDWRHGKALMFEKWESSTLRELHLQAKKKTA